MDTFGSWSYGLVGDIDEPCVVSVEKLCRCFNLITALAPGAAHRARKELNSRIEGSHRLTLKREKIIGRYKLRRLAQQFLSAPDQINNLFRPHRYRKSTHNYLQTQAKALNIWTGFIVEITAFTGNSFGSDSFKPDAYESARNYCAPLHLTD